MDSKEKILNEYLTVGEKLAKKWEFLVEGLDDYKKIMTSILLENTASKIVEETGSNLLTESFQSSDVTGINRILLPIIRRVYPHLKANEFVTIQPMLTPVAQIFYLRCRYGATSEKISKNLEYNRKGTTKAGDEFLRVPAYGTFGLNPYYSSQRIEDESFLDNNGEEIVLTGNINNGSYTKVLKWEPVVANSVEVCLKEFVEKERPVYNSVGGKLVKETRIEKIYGDTVFWAVQKNDGSFVVKLNKLNGFEPDISYDADQKTLTVTITYNFGQNQYALLANWEYNLEANNLIPEMRITIDTEMVEAKTRKLKTEFTQEALQDLRAYANIDAEAELVAWISSLITAEIDREIISDLLKNAAIKLDHNWATAAGNSVNFLDKNQALAQTILQAASKIYEYGKLGRGNWAVCSPTVAQLLASTRGYESANEGKFEEFDLGITYAGTLAGKTMKIYIDPYFPPNKVLVGYKGTSILATSYVYAPYQPLYTTPTIYDPNTLVPVIGFISRYGKKLVAGGEYLLAEITVSNLPTNN